MKKLLAILICAAMFAMCGAFAETDGSAADTAAVADAAPEASAVVEPVETDAPDDDPAEAESDEAGEPAPEADDEAPQADAEPFTVWFEEGFGLVFPEGWVYYPVSDAQRDGGLRYILGDGEGERYLYIAAQSTELPNAEALSGVIEANEDLEKTGDLTFGNTPFVAFIDPLQNLSGCATVWNGDILCFMFTPQSDSSYMMLVSEIMETFTTP